MGESEGGAMELGYAIAAVLTPIAAAGWVKLRLRGIAKAEAKHQAAYERALGKHLLRHLFPLGGGSGDGSGSSGSRGGKPS